MKTLAAATLTLMAGIALAPAPAQAQEACSLYRVKLGDSLREITEAAYGNDNFRPVYEANRAEIGRNPNIIRIGTVLRMPCLDGSAPEEAEVADEPAAFSLITANGYLPYTDESLDGRGMLVRLVETALLRSAPQKSAEVVFVNDWAAHLDALLPRQAFDASFPWTRPGCESQGKLTAGELYACQNYVYSDPLYEIVEGFFSMDGAGFETVVDFAGFEGSRICRPEGYPTGHLEEAGLMLAETEIVQPTGAHQCFALLKSGDVDLVALDTRAGERVIEDLGLGFQVVENPYLYVIQPLQVALHQDNPKSEELIGDINAGLKIMLESGEWASIVSEGLREHTAALVN
ncbi:MAG: transporter substrate-binding domain-containing protein [Pseudomonadota bacterium]